MLEPGFDPLERVRRYPAVSIRDVNNRLRLSGDNFDIYTVWILFLKLWDRAVGTWFRSGPSRSPGAGKRDRSGIGNLGCFIRYLSCQYRTCPVRFPPRDVPYSVLAHSANMSDVPVSVRPPFPALFRPLISTISISYFAISYFHFSAESPRSFLAWAKSASAFVC